MQYLQFIMDMMGVKFVPRDELTHLNCEIMYIFNAPLEIISFVQASLTNCMAFFLFLFFTSDLLELQFMMTLCQMLEMWYCMQIHNSINSNII